MNSQTSIQAEASKKIVNLIKELEETTETVIVDVHKNGVSSWLNHIDTQMSGLNDILEKWMIVQNVLHKDAKTPEEILADAANYFIKQKQDTLQKAD